MTTQPSFIIVGGGLAGALAAETLREEAFDGRITLLGEEQQRPYERPPLSKDYLQGKADRDTIFAHPEPWLGSPRRIGLPSSAPAGSGWRLPPLHAMQGLT
ncbi:MAG TPA: FAD-dependent oxidoreductase [Propionibacteriaceae bacterium]|jgi:NADPH-dependent 2,4-dienoyl-CoA reductase/sulfur reductase-like enzyme|nr:FAD-dependent oxidoreductase [Propionibacteriaceae bacterium]